MRRLSELIGLCTPGVSIRMICPAGRFPFFSTLTMPWIRFLVVCGLRVTIASFSPTSAFSRVDFPALGRPIIETNPERNAMSGPNLLWRGDALQADTHTLNAALSGVQNLEAETIVLENFAGCGDASRQLAHQSADGSRVLLVCPDPSQQFFQQIQIGVTVEDVGGVTLLYNVRFLMLIANLAHDLFDQVFNGYQPGDTSVLVGHNGQADVLLLHLAQQLAAQLGFRHEVHVGFHELPDRLRSGLAVRNLQ